MIHPATIGFDLDCVVIDTMEAFIRLAREEHQITVLPEQITEFQVEECLDMADATIADIFQRLIDDPVACAMQPIAGAVPVLQDMAMVAPLTFITARPDPAPISAWLTANLGSETAAASTLVAMGDHDGKAQHIHQQGLQYFIDDRFQTCEDLNHQGINALVFEQPWNKNRHNLPTVSNWQEIAALVSGTAPQTLANG